MVTSGTIPVLIPCGKIRYNHGNTDESFLRYVRDCAMPFFHPVGTCRMGEDVEDSVVSADSLRLGLA